MRRTKPEINTLAGASWQTCHVDVVDFMRHLHLTAGHMPRKEEKKHGEDGVSDIMLIGPRENDIHMVASLESWPKKGTTRSGSC